MEMGCGKGRIQAVGDHDEADIGAVQVHGNHPGPEGLGSDGRSLLRPIHVEGGTPACREQEGTGEFPTRMRSRKDVEADVPTEEVVEELIARKSRGRHGGKLDIRRNGARGNARAVDGDYDGRALMEVGSRGLAGQSREGRVHGKRRIVRRKLENPQTLPGDARIAAAQFGNEYPFLGGEQLAAHQAAAVQLGVEVDIDAAFLQGIQKGRGGYAVQRSRDGFARGNHPSRSVGREVYRDVPIHTRRPDMKMGERDGIRLGCRGLLEYDPGG